MVCAEPLTFVAYGPCGHRDACVECVARLRLVMEDKRCVICQRESDVVFVTRAMGDYTETIPAERFDGLRRRADDGELERDAVLGMFFDDRATCAKIRELRGLRCRACGDASAEHGSLKALRAHLREAHGLHHCEVCLEGRKVFVSQQLLYTKQQLDKHKYGGVADKDNAFGRDGFTGHPSCKFCKKFFYDEGQIFHHMQSAHETCHLCRRARPDAYVYYRDYDELERHHRKEHHACLHPDCLAKKFIVFVSANELKNHEGVEHGHAMTKAERKEALRLNDLGFTVGASGGGEGGGGASEGGGGGVPRSSEIERARRAARARAAAALPTASAAEAAQIEAALRASTLHGGSRESTSNGGSSSSMPRTNSIEEFPGLGPGGGGGGGGIGGGMMRGGWAGRGETASHTTPFAWCTPILKDFSRRHSSPALPFQRLTGKTFD